MLRDQLYVIADMALDAYREAHDSNGSHEVVINKEAAVH
jgi:hypothetical protein